jgi:hypothetical protein
MQSSSFERLQPNFEIIVPVRNQDSRRTEHEIWRDSKITGKAWTFRTTLVSKAMQAESNNSTPDMKTHVNRPHSLSSTRTSRFKFYGTFCTNQVRKLQVDGESWKLGEEGTKHADLYLRRGICECWIWSWIIRIQPEKYNHIVIHRRPRFLPFQIQA